MGGETHFTTIDRSKAAVDGADYHLSKVWGMS